MAAVIERQNVAVPPTGARRDAFDPTTRQVMHRTQIKGDRPA